MPAIPITSLPAAAAITDANQLPIVQGVDTFNATALNIRDYANGIRAIYTNIAARDADVANLTASSIVEVTDAGADPFVVNPVRAWYRYTGAGTTFVLISSEAQYTPPITELLGDWDMDTTGSIPIPHTITNWQSIKILNISIIDDADSFVSTLTGSTDGGTGGNLNITSTDFIFSRVNGGRFDSAGFNLTPFNRGNFTYMYIP